MQFFFPNPEYRQKKLLLGDWPSNRRGLLLVLQWPHAFGARKTKHWKCQCWTDMREAKQKHFCFPSVKYSWTIMHNNHHFDPPLKISCINVPLKLWWMQTICFIAWSRAVVAISGKVWPRDGLTWVPELPGPPFCFLFLNKAPPTPPPKFLSGGE